jgi:DNA-binding transcriptional regulator PaaX
MACLQKSVWITPDPVISDWKKLLGELDLTDWVLLFESAELGPVDDHEIAARVWHLEKINQEYSRYLSEFEPLLRQSRSADPSALEGEFGRAIRRESKAYFRILKADPLLPTVLLPSGFAGARADALHRTIRDTVRKLIVEGKP